MKHLKMILALLFSISYNFVISQNTDINILVSDNSVEVNINNTDNSTYTVTLLKEIDNDGIVMLKSKTRDVKKNIKKSITKGIYRLIITKGDEVEKNLKINNTKWVELK